MMSSDDRVEIREVCPRDGLQGEPPVSPGARADLARRLVACGIDDVEIAAFVSPSAVPAMAEAAAVVAALPTSSIATWWALVPNALGAAAARRCGVSSLTVTVSASTEYSRRNVRRSAEEALAALPEVVAAAGGAIVDVVVSCAFGSPFADVKLGTAVDTVERVLAAGADRVTLADTTGVATPRRVRALLEAVDVDVGLHLHDTRSTAMANALAALEAGARRFDTSVGGLGGSPYAPGAGGNLATETFVFLLDDLGVETGVDALAVCDLAGQLSDLVGCSPTHDVRAPLPAF